MPQCCQKRCSNPRRLGKSGRDAAVRRIEIYMMGAVGTRNTKDKYWGRRSKKKHQENAHND